MYSPYTIELLQTQNPKTATRPDKLSRPDSTHNTQNPCQDPKNSWSPRQTPKPALKAPKLNKPPNMWMLGLQSAIGIEPMVLPATSFNIF
jgi:hypothetical protein